MTGVGLVSPLGIGTEANWEALCAGQSGIGPITRFDATLHSARIAGEVKDFDPLRFIEKKDVKKMDVFIQLAIAAAQFAVDDARLKVTPDIATRVGVFIASGIGGFSTIEREHKALLEGGPRRISPFFIPASIINLAAGQVSIRFGAKGPNSATCTACSASAHAIGDALEIIRRGDADVMIAGGSEAAITPMGVGGFAAMRALSTRNDDPAHASRPFDRDRDGFVMGEGAGVIVLEELGLATRRGAPIYAELVGYGMSADAYHITAPSEDGDGGMRVMASALDDAGVTPDEVDYINAHGTSTPYNDKLETLAIRRLFGEHANTPRDLVDQVDDRPPARRGRRARGGDHRPGHQAPGRAADHQLRDPRSRVRSRLRAEYQAGDEDRLRAVQLVRVRRHQRGAAVQALRGLGSSVPTANSRLPGLRRHESRFVPSCTAVALSSASSQGSFVPWELTRFTDEDSRVHQTGRDPRVAAARQRSEDLDS